MKIVYFALLHMYYTAAIQHYCSVGTVTSIDVSQDATTIAWGTEHRIIEIWTSNTM